MSDASSSHASRRRFGGRDRRKNDIGTDMVFELWWDGVGRWYNQQDYLSAMECWKEALEVWRRSNDPERPPRDPHPHRGIEISLVGEALRALGQALEDDFEPEDQHRAPPSSLFAAPLWLFLAGCCLDAQDFPAARRALLACFRDCTRRVTRRRAGESPPLGEETLVRDVLQRALAEYVASFEEDPDTAQEEGAAMVADASGTLPAPSVGTRIAAAALRHLPAALVWTTDPHQRPGFVYPAVHSQPYYYYNDSGFDSSEAAGSRCPSWCNALEDFYPTIRDEFERLWQRQSAGSSCWPRVGEGDHRGGAGQHDGRVVAGGGRGGGSSGGDWRECVLFGSGEIPGVAPQTQRWLMEHVPDAVDLARSGGGEIIFSVLAPGTRIKPHCATTNLRLTAHLGLVVPLESSGRCRIRVADRWEHWEEGKVLVFDDSYEHEVENLTYSHRAVLLIRFWHPLLPPEARSRALDEAMQAKRIEELQRFHPPLPHHHDDLSPARRRALERSHCPRCGRSGIDGLRVSYPSSGAADSPLVHCACGAAIVS